MTTLPYVTPQVKSQSESAKLGERRTVRQSYSDGKVRFILEAEPHPVDWGCSRNVNTPEAEYDVLSQDGAKKIQEYIGVATRGTDGAIVASEVILQLLTMEQPVSLRLVRLKVRYAYKELWRRQSRERRRMSRIADDELMSEYASISVMDLCTTAEIREALAMLPTPVLYAGVRRMLGIPLTSRERQTLQRWRLSDQGRMCAWLSGLGPEHDTLQGAAKVTRSGKADRRTNRTARFNS